MNTTTLAKLIDETIELDRRIAADLETLKAKKKLLVIEAKARKDDHTKTENGGRSWTFSGASQGSVRVTFPAKKLKALLAPNDVLTVRELVGGKFYKLFQPVAGYALRPEFRNLVQKHLPGEAVELLKFCLSKSDTTVSFETKEAA